MTNRWLARVEPRGDARMRLLLFPFAGGAGSVFRTWLGAFGADVDVLPVQLPGREERFAEVPFTHIDPLADAMAEALLPLLDRPVALFGWSMGAAIAHAVVQRWETAGHRPAILIPGAHAAPHLPRVSRPIHALPRDDFWRELAGLGGVPEEVLAESELRDFVEPMLRADFGIVETRPQAHHKSISCPVAAIVADADAVVAAERVAEWTRATTGAARLIRIPGGHFVLRENAAAVRSAVEDALAWARDCMQAGAASQRAPRMTLRDMGRLMGPL